ncbi:myb/sant-like dna-binding domain [Holotrichia oblita]|uniref:Myb/sant-like dna-binding domain n=1 Tax=Holotrichia oblita TaxID=644536 RepID=A0ACB9SL99_HOLOL|nr:myb/sant-like dna-binding domain [Holotrichia oblita]
MESLLDVELEENMRVTVDIETAQALTDPHFAKQYTELIKQQLSLTSNANNSISSNTKESNLWKTKKPTELDHRATLALLDLRKQYDKEFADKKTTKNAIWLKIAGKMNEIGYYVGEGVEGREKLRQKYANLTGSYMKANQKMKATGEGKITYPSYYDEIDEIIGEKHKVNPPVIIDSLNISSGNISGSSELNFSSASSSQIDDLESTVAPSESKTISKKNRFDDIKTSIRPQKQKVIETLQEIHKENLENRQNEFKSMMDMLREQNEQRHQQMMALIANLTKSKDVQKKIKRKRESDSDS